MKLRVKQRDGQILGITLVSEDEGDREVLEALCYHDVSRENLIYRHGYVVLKAKVNPFRRK